MMPTFLDKILFTNQLPLDIESKRFYIHYPVFGNTDIDLILIKNSLFESLCIENKHNCFYLFFQPDPKHLMVFFSVDEPIRIVNSKETQKLTVDNNQTQLTFGSIINLKNDSTVPFISVIRWYKTNPWMPVLTNYSQNMVYLILEDTPYREEKQIINKLFP